MQDTETAEKDTGKRNSRRAMWGGIIAVLVLVTVLAVVLPGDGGGGNGGDGNRSPFEGHPVPSVQFVSPKTVQRNSTFSATVNISEVVSLWGAQFDIAYNPDIITLANYSRGEVGGVPADGVMIYKVGPGADGEGILRVLAKWDDYTDANNGYGANGSGYICRLEFQTGANKGTTGINFPTGRGEPPGERKIMRVWGGTIYGLDIKISTTVHVLPPDTSVPTATTNATATANASGQ